MKYREDIKAHARRKHDRYVRRYPCQDHYAYLEILIKHLDKAVRIWKESKREYGES